MKKLLLSFSLIFLFILFPINSSASNQDISSNDLINIHFFYRESCPHCSKEKEFLNEMKSKYSNLNIIFYEIEIDENKEKNSLFMNKAREEFSYATSSKLGFLSTPYTVIGTKEFIGFNSNIANQMELTIEFYNKNGYRDVVTEIISDKFDRTLNPIVIDDVTNYNEGSKNKDSNTESVIQLPIIGNVDVKTFSLPIIAFIIGTVDGFNPCAMWVLLFIITLCINNKDRKRMWIIGFTFLITSALIYFLIMAAWLQISLSFSSIRWVQIGIGLFALIGASISLRSYLKSLKKDDGCEVVDVSKKRKMILKIKDFTTKKSLFLALIGVVTLAISVNIVELACSAGLPLMYTQILALNDLSTIQYWLYMLLYIFFFMIDDIIIFTIAMITFKVTGLSTKYSKYSHLIGGIIMLIIGLLLLFKPSIIMLNF